jgi:nucleotide-binding universal stress UspA family protein
VFKRIVVAFREGDRTHAALRVAVALARASDAQLTALWVHEVAGYLPPPSHQERLERSTAQARFDRFSETLFELVSNAGVKASAHLLMGSFAAEVPRFVGERRCDLLVLTEREGRGWLGKIANFDVARVCRRVRCAAFVIQAGGGQADQLVARLGYAG